MGATRRMHVEQQQQKKRDKWYEDTTASLASMQEQLKALSAAQQSLKVSPAQNYGFAPNTINTATIGQQQVANANLRANPDNMAPSARRNMNKAA